jgi:hypothetical protein
VATVRQDILKEIELIRPELNIEKWIVFTTSTFRGKSKEFARSITLPDGSKVERKIVVGRINKTEVGVLRILDLKVYCALVKLWEESGRSTGGVQFALHEIAKILGWSWSGRTHQEIKAALVRLANIPIMWEDSFYRKEADTTERLLTNFHILEDLRIYERERHGQLSLALSSFRFNERLLQNLLSNYTKPLYLDTILGFQKEISVLLYRHLDLVMADKYRYSRRSKLLLEEDLKLSESYVYPSKRKQILEPVLEEHQGCKLSTGVLRYAGFEKTADGKDYQVIFEKVTFEKATKSSEQLPVVSDDPEIAYSADMTLDEHSLFLLLRERKIGAASALKLVKAYPERIKEKIEIFDWMVQTCREKIQNPTGFLRRMIEEDWSPPEGFVSQVEQEERAQKAKARQRELQRQDDARRAAEAHAEQARQQRREASPWKDLWEQIAEELAQRMPRQSFTIWIQPLFLADLHDEAIVIDCPSRFIKEYVEEKYHSLVEEAMATVCGEEKPVTFICSEETSCS